MKIGITLLGLFFLHLSLWGQYKHKKFQEISATCLDVKVVLTGEQGDDINVWVKNLCADTIVYRGLRNSSLGNTRFILQTSDTLVHTSNWDAERASGIGYLPPNVKTINRLAKVSDIRSSYKGQYAKWKCFTGLRGGEIMEFYWECDTKDGPLRTNSIFIENEIGDKERLDRWYKDLKEEGDWRWQFIDGDYWRKFSMERKEKIKEHYEKERKAREEGK